MTADGLEVLDHLVLGWRRDGERRRFVPGFDPLSGGTRSAVLVLMQSPGPATVARGDDAICAEDNPGPTATAYRRAREESGLRRDQVLRWNLVPWAIPGSPSSADVEEGRLALGELLPHLPRLAAIVTFGTAALDGVMRHLTLAEAPVVVPVLAAPHPSPANGRHRAQQHHRAVQALRLAAAFDPDAEGPR